jgi:hypothetical protein
MFVTGLDLQVSNFNLCDFNLRGKLKETMGIAVMFPSACSFVALVFQCSRMLKYSIMKQTVYLRRHHTYTKQL